MTHMTNQDNSKVRWYKGSDPLFQISGFAWFERDRVFRRLPINPPAMLPPRVDELSDCTSGGQLRFKTNARTLKIKVELSGPASMGHMTALGQCGFDLYIGELGNQQYLSSAIPPLNEVNYESVFWDFSNVSMADEFREVTINFPLYQGVKDIQIGTDWQASIEAPSSYASEKRIIFYGTSILQGGCASRPGMSYTNILSRRFPIEFINLGFSGNGKGEEEVALTIREIERQACFVVDYEANVSPQEYEATLEPFLKLYREYHQELPIIVISRINYSRDIFPERYAESVRRRNHAKTVVEKRRENGDTNISFIDGANLLGRNWAECTVDGTHPNDLGFMHMALALEDPIAEVLTTAGIRLN